MAISIRRAAERPEPRCSAGSWQTAVMPPGSVDLSPPRLLVLWDIDHTLIETRGVGHAIYQRAFKTATGKELEQLAEVSGRTELEIMAETLRINGLEPTNQATAKLARALIDSYNAARNELATKGRALPGARETLALLAQDSRLHQSVLTGNLKDVARTKVEVFGLAQYLDLETSAYGEDNHNRAELVHYAQERAQAMTGIVFTSKRTVLIGDTPNDIRAGKAAGAHVIGIASGKSNREELRAAGAEWVLVDLMAQQIHKWLSRIVE